MKKKLMFSFALVILMFSLVITYSIYNLNSVSDELVHNRTINLSFYQQNNKFKEEILNFKSNISKIFIFDSIEDIENIYGTASENINSAQSILKEIKDTKYAELHLLKFPNEKEIPLDEPIEESKDEDTVSEITVLEAIDEVESGLGSMQKYADILYSQYKKVAENRNQFQDSYKKVYNSYRLVDFYPFLNDKKSINRFLNLSRAMFTTMASNSTRDLNFVGRSKFNSSVKYFDSLISEDKNYENFKNEYQKLFDTAIFISSNKPQNIFELFELETKSLNSSINTLLVISDKLFEKSQDSILSRVSNLKVLPIVISIIVAIVGLVISWISLSNISNSIMKIVNEFTQQSIRLQNSSNQVVEFGNQLKSQTIQQMRVNL